MRGKTRDVLHIDIDSSFHSTMLDLAGFAGKSRS